VNMGLFMANRLSNKKGGVFTKVITRISVWAIALSTATIIITISMILGFQQQIKDKVSAFSGHIQISPYNRENQSETNPLVYSDSLVNNIVALPPISHVQAFANVPALLRYNSVSEGVVLKAVDAHYKWSGFATYLMSGKLPDSGSLGKGIVISQLLADKMQLKIKDTLLAYIIDTDGGKKHKLRQYHVTATFTTGLDEFDKAVALIDMVEVKRLKPNWIDGQISGLEVFTNKFNEIDTSTYQIAELPDLDKELDILTIQDRMPQIFDWLSLLNIHIKIIIILMGTVAIINMVTALIIMILERNAMIGLLKTLGMKNKALMQIFLISASRLIIKGLIIGNLLAIGLLAMQYYTHIIKLDAEQYYLSEAPVSFPWLYMVLINVGVLLVCSISMLVPSLLVLKTKPAAALKSF